MKKTIHVVAAAIRNEKNEIFICQRSPKMTFPNYWEFPGGKVEIGETEKDALVREINEELNCIIEVVDYIATSTFEYETFIISLSVYYASIIKGTPQIIEHTAFAWEDPKNLVNYPFPLTNELIISKILKGEIH